MIGKLKGIIDTIEDNQLILDVGGVGYLVHASSNTLRSLPAEGEAATLLIETHVREDHIHLYGFAEAGEKQWFNILTTVKGVGNKMGLAILSTMNPQQINTAIVAQDKAAFTQVSGVGPRLAERLLTELKNKTGTVSGDTEIPTLTVVPGADAGSLTNDAISALTNLGYNRSIAYGAVNRITTKQPDIGLEDLIREGLKELVSA